MSVKQIQIFYCILSQIQYFCLEKSKPNEPSWDIVKQCGSRGRMCRTIQSPCHDHHGYQQTVLHAGGLCWLHRRPDISGVTTSFQSFFLGLESHCTHTHYFTPCFFHCIAIIFQFFPCKYPGVGLHSRKPTHTPVHFLLEVDPQRLMSMFYRMKILGPGVRKRTQTTKVSSTP